MDWDALRGAAQIPWKSRIFINRNLRMSGVSAIGFDMDHTLALYEPRPFEDLAFEESKRKLIDSGYPASVAGIRYDPAFVIRGLVVDKRRGNILKMDQHRYVSRAWHGMRSLPDPVRKRLYQTQAIHLSGDDYATIDTPFSLPEIALYARMVDLADRARWPARDYRKLYEDVRGAMDEAHADGSIKSRIAKDPDRYLLRDPALPATLARLKAHGYRLFLLTNSEPEYTSLIMDRLLGRGSRHAKPWTEFFDVIIVRAGKPAFFRNRSDLKPVALPGVVSRREAAKTFLGGGVSGLEKRLGCAGDRILYFGDHTYGDILKSKRVCLWRTAMIVQELEREIRVLERCGASLRDLQARSARRDELDLIRDHLERAARGEMAPHMPAVTRVEARRLLRSVTAEIARHDARIEELLDRCEREHNVHWGPLFRTGREISHFAAQVRDFACIYTSRVSNFLYYPVDKYFQVHPEGMPHEG